MKDLRLDDPERLKAKAERLKALGKRDGSAEAVEGLAEAYFRLALHPRTDTAESIGLLLEAYKLDGANPRYAYHLARIFFVLGRLEAAERWLKEAVRFCPSSHRLWAHVGLLQFELNERYKADTKYEPDELLRRAEEIMLGIREGRDAFDAKRLLDFEPPISRAHLEAEARKGQRPDAAAAPLATGGPSETAVPERAAPPRIQDPKTCRWSGVVDLEIERLLENAASARVRDKLTPLLQDIVKRIDGRLYGRSAFVITAVQWLVAGYAPATIRRLRMDIPVEGPDPALDLLDRVCGLFEEPLETLPAKLSGALAERAVPPFVAAMIHQKRLLWRPVVFPAMRAYRSAQKALGSPPQDEGDEEAEEKAAALIKALVDAAKKLDTPPPSSIPEANPEEEIRPLTAGEARDVVGKLDASCQKLKAACDGGFRFLRTDLEPRVSQFGSNEAWARAAADSEASAQFIDLVGRAGEAGAARVGVLSRQIQDVPMETLDSVLRPDLPEEARRNIFAAKLEEIRNAFNALKRPSSLLKVLKNVDAKIKAAAARFEARPVSPSAAISTLIADVKAAFPEAGIKDQSAKAGRREDTPVAPGAAAEMPTWTGRTGLAKAVRFVDGEIDRIFGLNLSTFGAYSAGQRALPEFQTLQLHLLAQAGETLYRMGRRGRASELWRQGLTVDRLCLPILRNIAVDGTLGGTDHGRSLQSWKEYCEMLYFHAIAGGDPGVSAKARADFHRDYASAFSCGYVREDKEPAPDEEGRGLKLIGLLESPGRLREFIAHKRAELLNRWFEMRTPTLLLGVGRSVRKPEEREKRKAALMEFVQEVCADLPERVGPGFRKVCASKLEAALRFCRSPEGLTLARNPHYQEDERRLTQWAQEIYGLKEQFYYGFFYLAEAKGRGQRQGIGWETKVRSIDYLFLLERLNDVPVGLNPEIVEASVKSWAARYQKPADEMVRTLDEFLGTVVLYLFKTMVERRDLDRFDQFGRSLAAHKRYWTKILGLWDKDPEHNRCAQFLDAPVDFYPENVMAVLKNEAAPEDRTRAALDALRPWSEKYPGMTGPYRHCALLLCRLNRPKEAADLLERAIRTGVWGEGLKQSRELLSQIKGQALVSEEIKNKDFRKARGLVLAEVTESPQGFEPIDRLLTVYGHWIKEKPAEGPALIPMIENDIAEALEAVQKADEKADPSGDAASRIITSKRDLMIGAALAPFGQLDTPEKCRNALPHFQKIISLDAGNASALLYLSVCHYHIGVGQYRTGREDRGKREFEQADTFASRVLDKSSDPALKDQARQIRDQVRQVLETL